MAEKENKFKSKNIIFIGIWVFCFLLIFIAFLVKQNDIKTNLKSTRFFERIWGTTPAFIEHHEDSRSASNQNNGGTTIIDVNANGLAKELTTNPGEPRLKPNNSFGFDNQEPLTLPAPEESSEINNGDFDPNASCDENIPPQIAYENDESFPEYEEKTKENPKPPVSKAASIENSTVSEFMPQLSPATATARLCFMSLENDGAVIRKPISRKIVKTDAPLTNNIRLLLAGPEKNERDAGCRSFIPEGTQLLSAVVTNGIAYLNFSEEFEFNHFGPEGYLAQLMQIVYTSTEFNTVKSVQFLIEGQKKEYLTEGVWIGAPLSRASFK